MSAVAAEKVADVHGPGDVHGLECTGGLHKVTSLPGQTEMARLFPFRPGTGGHGQLRSDSAASDKVPEYDNDACTHCDYMEFENMFR